MTTDVSVALTDAEQGSSLWHDAWIRLSKNKMAVGGGAILLTFIVVALLTPWIAPYSYEAQNLDLGASPPSAAHWLGTDVERAYQRSDMLLRRRTMMEAWAGFVTGLPDARERKMERDG